MSADNGIYIAKFPDGYRVIHAQAIDNLDFFPVGTEEWKNIIDDYFCKTSVVPTLSHALTFAENMALSYPILEYGICVLDDINYVPNSRRKIMETEIKERLQNLAHEQSRKFWHYFNAVGWTWQDTEPRTPSILEIYFHMDSLIDALKFTSQGYALPEGYSISSGGVEVGYTDKDEEGFITVFINFIDTNEDVMYPC